MSWATFFYVFSSILLVVTMAVAMIAIFLKKHPIKSSEKFENEHDRDIQTTSAKTKKTPAFPNVPKNNKTLGMPCERILAIARRQPQASVWTFTPIQNPLSFPPTDPTDLSFI